MDFNDFCKDENEYCNFLKDYRNIIQTSYTCLQNESHLKSDLKKFTHQNSVKKGFFGNPDIPPKNGFEKFEIKSYGDTEPYNDNWGPSNFCDKCKGRFTEEYINSNIKRNKPEPIKRPEIPEHLLGKRPISRSSSQPHCKEIKKEMAYKIVVKTNSESNCGTRARVFIRLVGKTEKSDPIELKKNFGSLRFYFAPNSKEIFYIKNIKLSDLKGVNIKLDAVKDTDEWLADWLLVEELSGERRKWTCKIGRFLSNCRKDCQLVAKLKAMRETMPIIKYKIKINIAQDSVEECYGFLKIRFSGDKGKTENLLLKNEKSAKLKRGSTALFVVEHADLGNLSAICLSMISSTSPSDSENRPVTSSMENKKSGKSVQRKGWEDVKIDSVIIEWVDSNEKPHELEFLMNKWIGLSDKVTEKSIILKSITDLYKNSKKRQTTDKQENTTYNVTFLTGKKSLSGTDATVYIQFYGKGNGWSQTYEFVDFDKKKFERGNEDSFRVSGPNIGSIKKIRIWHNNKGLASGWKLEKVLETFIFLSILLSSDTLKEKQKVITSLVIRQFYKKVIVVRHLTSSEICNALNEMKYRSSLPKEIKLQDGKVLYNEDILVNNKEKRTKINSSPMVRKKKKGINESDYSSSSDSTGRNDVSLIDSKRVKKHENGIYIFNLPYAEETRFICNHWLSSKSGEKSLNQTLTAEGSSILCSPINLKINPDN